MKNTSKEDRLRELARKIGQFYLKKYENDYKKTAQSIKNLMVCRLELEDEYIVITTARPGVLIGAYGRNINDLEQYLGVKIKIKEEFLLDLLMPQDPNEYFDY